MTKGEKKPEYFAKITQLFLDYDKVLIVQADNVGSSQMHQIRKSLRGIATVLFGKNTMIRKALSTLVEQKPELEAIVPLIKGNIGLVFTDSDLKGARELVVANKVKAPAKAGALSPIDVYIEAANTGMDPGKTSFFQALGIPTKISRGTIEITSRVHLLTPGQRVGPSEAALLNVLNISPFTYGLTVTQVYDNGSIFDQSILDIDEAQLLKSLSGCISEVAALSLAINIPTIASVPHMLINAYKDLLAVSVVTDYTFEGSAKIKEILANPEAFAAAAAAAAPAASAAKVEAAPEPEEEEEEEEADFDLFD